MSDNENGGGANAAPPPEGEVEREHRELMQMALAQAVATTSAILHQLFPLAPQNKVIEIAQKVTLETAALREQVLPTILGLGAQVSDPNPYWGVKIHARVGVSIIHVPKKLPANPDTMQAWQYATAVGLLMDPLMRGVVLMSGHQYEFFQTPAEPPGEKKRSSGIVV